MPIRFNEIDGRWLLRATLSIGASSELRRAVAALIHATRVVPAPLGTVGGVADMLTKDRLEFVREALAGAA